MRREKSLESSSLSPSAIRFAFANRIGNGGWLYSINGLYAINGGIDPWCGKFLIQCFTRIEIKIIRIKP